jgi:hypothetical protein
VRAGWLRALPVGLPTPILDVVRTGNTGLVLALGLAALGRPWLGHPPLGLIVIGLIGGSWRLEGVVSQATNRA